MGLKRQFAILLGGVLGIVAGKLLLGNAGALLGVLIGVFIAFYATITWR